MTLRQQEPVVPSALDQPPTRLNEASLDTGQRPTVDQSRSNSRRHGFPKS
jgi:hypothetical protein